MVLKEPYMEKIVEDANTISLTARETQSIKVKNVEIYGLTTEQLAELYVEKTLVNCVKVAPSKKNMLIPIREGVRTPNLWRELEPKGIILDIPLAEGETLTVKTKDKFTYAKITYELWDAGDILNTMPNGSKAVEYTYFVYGTNAEAWKKAGYHDVNKAITPAEYPAFPFGVKVPSGYEIEVLGLFANEFAVDIGDGTSYLGSSISQRLRLMKIRECLFDADMKGFMLKGIADTTYVSTTARFQENDNLNQIPYQAEGIDGKLFLLPTPLKFIAGEELTPQIEITYYTNADVEADKVDVGFLLRSRKV